MADPPGTKTNPPVENVTPPEYSAIPEAGSMRYQETNTSPPYPPGNAYNPYPPGMSPYPNGTAGYPPYPVYYTNNTGYGQQPPPPITVSYTTSRECATTTTVPQSGATIVYQQAAGNCPKCHIGNMQEHYTTAGLCLACWLFPLGIICCLAMTVRVCNHCRHVIG